MYYHSDALKYIKYGKILPYRDDSDWLSVAYKWLGFYCGYYPQVWLSRSQSSLTGFRCSGTIKKSKRSASRRSQIKMHRDVALFGFENIKGFPVDYDIWSSLLNGLINEDFDSNKEQLDKAVSEYLDRHKKWAIEGEYIDEASDLKDWCGDLDAYLNKHLFVEKNQVVVPSLNLKSAKKIICRNDKQKKTLRRMGFIEDRIDVRNVARQKW